MSSKNYRHAQIASRKHKDIKNLGEYQDHYKMQDVIQLIDIEINFSKNIHNGFKIEPFSFVTLASFSASREAAPKTTKKNLNY